MGSQALVVTRQRRYKVVERSSVGRCGKQKSEQRFFIMDNLSRTRDDIPYVKGITLLTDPPQVAAVLCLCKTGAQIGKMVSSSVNEHSCVRHLKVHGPLVSEHLGW